MDPFCQLGGGNASCLANSAKKLLSYLLRLDLLRTASPRGIISDPAYGVLVSATVVVHNIATGVATAR